MINPNVQEEILAEYDRESGFHLDLANTSAKLLERILLDKGVKLHSITHRCKSRQSLLQKLRKHDKTYKRLSDITDISAVRIITYFAEDVDQVAKIVEQEFSIDHANSTDKRKLLDPDRFGYQSVHYVATLTPDRCRLAEYARFNSYKVEIQVRSILQHAWAEIEHDLGYKSAAGVPRSVLRRFARVAGLLELADDEFSTIRNELNAYASEVPMEILTQPENVGIDQISLRALVSTKTSFVRQISEIVANIASARLTPPPDGSLERDVANLVNLNVNTIDKLERTAASNLKIVKKFAKHWIGESRYVDLYEDIGILYLSYVILAQQADDTKIREFVDSARLGAVEERQNLVTQIRAAYQAATTPS